VTAVFTLWQPTAWRSTRGLLIRDPEARVTELYGALLRTPCLGYDALTMRTRGSVTVIYIRESFVWGFGLLRKTEPVCR
jgi:hypothetical protein